MGQGLRDKTAVGTKDGTSRVHLRFVVYLGAASLIVWFLWARFSNQFVSFFWPIWARFSNQFARLYELAGFGFYTTSSGEVVQGKTLWDWLELFIIPVTLLLGEYLLTNMQRARDKQS